FFNRPLPRRDPPVVQHGLAQRVPDEEDEQEDQADDRHVVGLGHDQAEVRIERAEDEEDREYAEDAVADRVLGDLLALPYDERQPGDREREERLRIRDGVYQSLNKAHVYSKSEV